MEKAIVLLARYGPRNLGDTNGNLYNLLEISGSAISKELITKYFPTSHRYTFTPSDWITEGGKSIGWGSITYLVSRRKAEEIISQLEELLKERKIQIEFEHQT